MNFRRTGKSGSEAANFSAAFEIYGVRIGVHTDSPELLRRIERAIDLQLRAVSRAIASEAAVYFFRIEIISPGAYRLIGPGGEETFEGVDEKIVTGVLMSRLRLVIAERAEGKICVHAGVVGWKGKALVVPARTFAGKTTLIKELTNLGAIYYSDDCAVLDESGLVHPFPKTLSLRGLAGKFEQVEYPVEHFGGVRGQLPIPVRMILLTGYREKAPWRPRRLSVGQGVMELLSHTIPIRYNPEFALKVLNNALNRAIIVKMKRGEAKVFAVRLLKYFELNA